MFVGVGITITISVIIPIYNVENYLPVCLDSLVGQDFKDVEFICVNDGSTDKSLEICNRYAESDSRIKVISQDNGGPAKARNRALDIASGDYICFVDSDDYMEAGTLNELITLCRKGNYDIVVYGANVVYKGDIPEWVVEATSPRNASYESIDINTIFEEAGCTPFIWLHFIKSSLIQNDRIRINEDLNIGEDQAFGIMYFLRAKKVLFTSKKMYNYRLFRPGSQMDIYSTILMDKMWQHLKMISYVISESIDDMGSKEEVAFINWILEIMYWDMIKLLYYDQAKYIDKIFELLNYLNVDNHFENFNEFNKVKLKHLQAIYLYHGEPDKIIESMNQIESSVDKIADCLNTNKIIRLYERIKKYLIG